MFPFYAHSLLFIPFCFSSSFFSSLLYHSQHSLFLSFFFLLIACPAPAGAYCYSQEEPRLNEPIRGRPWHASFDQRTCHISMYTSVLPYLPVSDPRGVFAQVRQKARGPLWILITNEHRFALPVMRGRNACDLAEETGKSQTPHCASVMYCKRRRMQQRGVWVMQTTTWKR